MELFDYQRKAIEKLKHAFRNDKKAVIIRLDCGAGKTVIAAELARTTNAKNNNVLFLVHREELKDQTIEEFNRYGINTDSENLKIEMIITAGRRLVEFQPQIIIADECNFALAKSWRKVFEQHQDALIVGLSATPERLDGKPMGELFDEIVEVISADELTKLGRLCPYDYFAPKLEFELDKVKSRAGDYAPEDLEKVLSKPKIYGDIMTYFRKYIPNSKVIVYCANINHSKTMAQEFVNNGIAAVHFDGTTPKAERKRIVEDFRNGTIQVLCNCELISFGFNVPDCDAVILARPTKSRSLYIQQSMRCLRGQPNKRATILDFVANVYRHGMPTTKQHYTLSGKATKCPNPDGEPDVLARQCKACYKTYEGINRICPYCGFDNGLTPNEIKVLEKAELERIETIEKYKKMKQRGTAKTIAELIAFARKENYKNPEKWAEYVYNARLEKEKINKARKRS